MEEEGMKEGGGKPKGARTADKSGWIKKGSGGLLGHWKDRYLLLCHAQLLIYENEDEQKCVETVELGSYEKCQDLRALLKRKHRFILLRSPGNKVSDLKFQASSGEEKESWIKALNEGINRGKNKAFDEVKVDKTCALEHMTRDRVRGGQRRRPPTRIHLKEVAKAASDGFVRLDLDVPDSGPPELMPSSAVSAAQPQPQPQPREALRPPAKPSPVPETTSLRDIVEPPAGDRAPTPVFESAEAQPKGPSDSEKPTEEDSGSKEPPNSTLLDKMKVGWETPGPEDTAVPEEAPAPEEPPAPEKPPTPEKPPSSEESPAPQSVELTPRPSLKTLETPRREGRKPPAPPPKVLSEKMRVCLSRGEASGPAHSLGTPEPSALSPVPVSVNGVDDGPEPVKASPEVGTPETAPEEAAESLAQPPKDSSSQFYSRCSSLGDLLSDGSQRPQLPGERLYRAQLEVQVASKQTERLLGEVLGSQPPPAHTETLLSQAVEQLRQATQVLQEMRDSDSREPGQEAPGLRKKQKELVTLYRRSMP